jgi:hypothetical protein
MRIGEVRQIEQRECFKVWNMRVKGKLVRVTTNGDLEPYPYQRRAPDHWTVEQYRENRLRNLHPGVTFDVLMGDGKPARGNMRLRTVRASWRGHSQD